MSLRLASEDEGDEDRPTEQHDAAGEAAGDAADGDVGGDPGDPGDDIGGELEFRREVGLRLRTERLRRGLSQQELGTGAGLTRAAVGKIERGAHKVDVWRLHLLSRVLGVELGALLGERHGAR